MKQAGRFLSKYIKRNFGVFAIYMLLCILCSILSLIAPYISGKNTVRNSIIFIVTHDDKITDKVDHIINLSKNA